jgi:hypothetical protein
MEKFPNRTGSPLEELRAELHETIVHLSKLSVAVERAITEEKLAPLPIQERRRLLRETALRARPMLAPSGLPPKVQVAAGESLEQYAQRVLRLLGTV